VTSSPVVAVVYNREQRVMELLDVLRAARPRVLFLAADGPRPGDAADAQRCEATRTAISRIDWPCEVVEDFADDHLGCAARVVSALDRVFATVDRAIVLEDDVRPAWSFFPFCDAMLDRYADDERVMHVDGGNRLGAWRPEDADHHFAHHGNVWGWATWARAWAHYDVTLDRYRTPAARAAIEERALDDAHRTLLAWMLDCEPGVFGDAWDYQWTLARYAAGGLSVVPARNLVTNVGFGTDATHTVHADDLAAATSTFSLEPAFAGAREVVVDDDLDRALLRFERLRGLREATVGTLVVQAMADPRVRHRLAPNPAVMNTLAALDDPEASLHLLRVIDRTNAPSPARTRLIAEFERLLAVRSRAGATA
jgi:hypothetical protein